MRRKIVAVFMAVVLAAACAVPAFAESRTLSGALADLGDRTYRDFVETPAKYLTVDYATLMKDARNEDLDAVARDFSINVLDVTDPLPEITALHPGNPQVMSPSERRTNQYVADITKMNMDDVDNKGEVGLKPVVLYYGDDGSLVVYMVIYNKTDKDITVNGIDRILLQDDARNSFAGGQNIPFHEPLVVKGGDSPWVVVLKFKAGTFVPGTNLAGMNNPRIKYNFTVK